MISIISPLYVLSEKVLDQTRLFFGDMKKALKPEDEFIIVDNGSTLGRDEFIEMADTYIRTPKNLGYGGAINLGLKLSNNEFLLMPNNDIRISSEWRDKMLEVFKQKEHVDAISYHQPTMLDSTGIGFTGLFWMMRREVYEKIGLFDTDYGLGRDQDRDYWCLMRQNGFNFDTVEFELEHVRRSTYNQPEFRKRHGSNINYGDSPFQKKWGFHSREWYKKDIRFLKKHE